MTRENPNPAAFFFDDGDFLNLEEVAFVTWFPDGHAGSDYVEETDDPALLIYTRSVDAPISRETPTESERTRLMDALRIYHSKA